MRTITCLAIAALLGAGCRKPQPSPAYIEASGSYTTLLARLGDDAFSDPEMDRIEQLLNSVPASSADAQAAAELKAKIAAERTRVEQEAAEREKAAASALAPTAPVDFGTRPPEPEAAAETVDAGPSSDLQPGMSLEALRSVSQGCFSSTGPLKLRNADGSEGEAEMFERLDSTRCNEKYAKYATRFLVVKEGKLVGDFPKTALTQLKLPPPQPPPAPKPPPPSPPPTVEPGGDKPPTPLPAPTSPGENTGPAQ